MTVSSLLCALSCTSIKDLSSSAWKGPLTRIRTSEIFFIIHKNLDIEKQKVNENQDQYLFASNSRGFPRWQNSLRFCFDAPLDGYRLTGRRKERFGSQHLIEHDLALLDVFQPNLEAHLFQLCNQRN